VEVRSGPPQLDVAACPTGRERHPGEGVDRADVRLLDGVDVVAERVGLTGLDAGADAGTELLGVVGPDPAAELARRWLARRR